MITFKEGQRFADYTSEWYVYLDKTYTVGEFLNELLKMKPDDTGYIHIVDVIYDCLYSEGKIQCCKLTNDILSKTIQSVGCYGCFNSFNYHIRVKEDR